MNAIESSTIFLNSAGVLGAGVMPCFSINATISGALRASTMAALSSATIAGGIPFGPTIPNHVNITIDQGELVYLV